MPADSRLQLIEQAREHLRAVMRNDDLAKEGAWSAQKDYHGSLERHVWYVGCTTTPTLYSAQPYRTVKAITEDSRVAGLLTFISTALPQLCDLAEAALSASPARGEGDAPDIEAIKKAAYLEGWNDREDDFLTGVARVAPTPAIPAGEELREKVARIIAEDDVRTWVWREDAPDDAFERSVAEQLLFCLKTADRILAALQPQAEGEWG